MPVLQPGQRLLHYQVLEKIGQGGMGEVYKALDSKLGRSVALKILPFGVGDRAARQRLLQEARSASALSHPGIVTVHALESVDDFDFIVMEFVAGASLREKLAEGPLSLPDLLDLAAEITDALVAAHQGGIVHRDIKPANIIRSTAGRWKLLDFGLAKIVESEAAAADQATTLGLTAAGIRVGTVPYMSPEQSRGEPLDGRTDVFSLGAVLYEAATGRRPFDGPTALAILHEVASINPPPPSSTATALPPEIDLVIQRALAKDREHRYSAAELLDAVQALRQSLGRTGAVALPAERVEREAWRFVGREPELRRLDEALRQAVAGQGSTMLITGEPGIGKTTLADEFVRRARRQYPTLLVSRGRCVEQYGTGEAYLPFLDALGSLVGGPGGGRVAVVLRSHAPTWCLQLPAAFGSSDTQAQLQRETIGATKDRMLRELGDALAALAAGMPLLLLFEDLHWADTPSIDLLRHLCQRVGEQRLLIVGTFRPEEVERGSHPLQGYRLEMLGHRRCEELRLPMLSAEHVQSYLDTRFAPNDFSHHLTALIQRKTDGHPLFATSLVELLLTRGAITRTNGGWTLPRPLAEQDIETPEGVRSIIRKKLDALTEDDQRALQYASVEGEEFRSTVLAQLLGVTDLELEERLDRLDKVHRLIQTLGEEELPDATLAIRYRFHHALYQNVLYDSLVSKRRVLLHRQIGERLLEHYGTHASRIAAQLATHFERGRDFARAVTYHVQAADNAMRAYANAEAEALYAHALELVDRLDPAAGAEQAAQIYRRRGIVRHALSRFGEAADDFTRLIALARQRGDHDSEFAGLASLTQSLFFSHRLEETGARATEALALAERSGDARQKVEVLNLVALKQLCYGELAEARPTLDEAVRLARAADHRPALVTALTWRAALHYWQSAYTTADALVTEAIQLNRDVRDSFNLMVAMFMQGLVRGNRGLMSDALDVLNEAIAIARRNGDMFMWPRLPNCIGWIHRELQDFSGAVEHDRHGFDVGHTHGVLEAQANSLINLGIDYTHVASPDRTVPAFHQAEEIFTRDAWFRWRYNIRLQAGWSEHWLGQGDLDQAQAFADRLRETALAHEAWKYVAVAYQLRARVARARGKRDESLAELARALDELRDHPCPIVAWRVWADLGRLHAEVGDAEASRRAFQESASIVHEIAGHVRDEALRTTFLRSEAVREILAGSSKS